MQHNIEKINSVHIDDIKAYLNLANNTKQFSQSKNFFSFYDSIYQDNFFIIVYNNELVVKSKFAKKTNNTFPLELKKENQEQHDKISSIIFAKQNILVKTIKNEIVSFSIPNLSYESFYFNFSHQKVLNGIIQKKQIKKISCGLNHILFLSYGGMIYSTGDNAYGQLGIDGQLKNSNEQNLITNLIEYNIEDIFSGNNFNIVYGKKRLNEYNKINSSIPNEDIVLSWGDNSYGQCGHKISKKMVPKPKPVISFESNIKGVAVGINHCVLLFDNGELVMFGNNEYKQCGLINNKIREREDKIIGINWFDNNAEYITKVKTGANSTLLMGDKGSVLILGKIVSSKPLLFQINPINVLDEIIFSDEQCIFIHHNPKNSTLIINPLPNETIENYYYPSNLQPSLPTLTQTQEPNVISSNSEISFDDLLMDENTLSLNSTNPSDTSLYELRSYINLLGISLSSSYESSDMSFRPSNLPPKTKAEEEAHRRLVQENRARYRELVKHKQELEKANIKAQEQRQENEEKRANYWLKEIVPNWTIMKSNKNFEHYFYEGIPPKIRGQIWLLSVGNKFSITKDYYNIEVKKSIQLLMKQNTYNSEKQSSSPSKEIKELYSKYIVKTTNKEKSIHVIELDIERTFSYLGVYKNNSPISNDLREILGAFVVRRPDIGYVQGLSYIAGTLLLQMDKFQSFVCLMNITLNPNILPFYRLEEKGIKQRLEIFNEIFMCNLPKLFEHFNCLDVLPEHYLIEWMMTLFTRNLHIDLTVRIWDVYMIEGIKCLYKAAIVILVHFEKKFLEMDFDDILTNLKNIQEMKMNQDTFVDSMRNVKFTDKILHKIQRLNEDYIPIN